MAERLEFVERSKLISFAVFRTKDGRSSQRISSYYVIQVGTAYNSLARWSVDQDIKDTTVNILYLYIIKKEYSFYDN